MSEHDLFNAAIKLTTQQRMAFLDAACGHDPQLRVQVEALLKAHDESGGFSRNRLIGNWTPRGRRSNRSME